MNISNGVTVLVNISHMFIEMHLIILTISLTLTKTRALQNSKIPFYFTTRICNLGLTQMESDIQGQVFFDLYFSSIYLILSGGTSFMCDDLRKAFGLIQLSVSSF